MTVPPEKKTSTRNIARIGRHSELLARGIADPLAYAKQKVAEANEQQKSGKVSMELPVDFTEKLRSSDAQASSSASLDIGYFFLQAVYHQLKLKDFFKKVTADSKPGTYDNLGHYFEQPSIQYQHLLRTMDILYRNYDAYISHLYEQSERIVKRDTSVCYFDCTNFYFETESEDTDVDEVTGEILKGFRRYGPSKEHRPNPLVEMGLFMDSQGIPISMCLAAGSENEQTLAIPLEEKITRMFHGRRFIYCADAGLMETVVCKNGKKKRISSEALLHQTIIVTFSRKMMEYQRHIRNGQIDRGTQSFEKLRSGDLQKGA